MTKVKCLFFIGLIMTLFQACQTNESSVMIPVQENKFTWIYHPKADTFPGPATPQLESGKLYDIWVTNDHTFIKGTDGKFHLFGITHPITGTQNVHEGEFLSFHAKESDNGFLADQGFEDLPKVLPPAEREGERLENHAPYIVKKDELYYMVYGPSPMRMAVSKDLYNWQTKGDLFEQENGARDPSIFRYNGKYYILFCTGKNVGMRSSADLINWSDYKIIFEAKDFDPESPSVIIKDGAFYLFVCSWDGVWDKKEVVGAYQHKTYVYYSEQHDDFLNREAVTTLNAHAPEIFKHEEQWYISSVEWPNRGVSVDKLNWK